MRQRIASFMVALAILVFASIPATANAAEALHVRGTACAGGSISALYYYTEYETTNSPVYSGNNFDIHLLHFERYSGTTLHFSIKCSNNQWYYPVRSIPWWATNPYWVGAV